MALTILLASLCHIDPVKSLPNREETAKKIVFNEKNTLEFHPHWKCLLNSRPLKNEKKNTILGLNLNDGIPSHKKRDNFHPLVFSSFILFPTCFHWLNSSYRITETGVSLDSF